MGVAVETKAQGRNNVSRRESPRRVPRGQLRRRLLEPGPGKQHLVGPAELGPARDPQRLLGERGSDKIDWILGPERRRQRERGLRAHVHPGQPPEQLLPSRRQRRAGVRSRSLLTAAGSRYGTLADRVSHESSLSRTPR